MKAVKAALGLGMAILLAAIAIAAEGAKPTKTPAAEAVKAVKKPLIEGRKGNIAEVVEAKAQVVIESEGVKVTANVVADTIVMKDGKKASLKDFKAGDAVMFGFKPRSKTDLRFLADELSFIAFIRRETVKGEVISFDREKGELKLKTEKGEETIALTKVTRYFLGGKQLKGADVQLKPGDKVYVGYSVTGMAYAVFDEASWKPYAQVELKRAEKKAQKKEGVESKGQKKERVESKAQKKEG
ncbi:MAG: hypothetical protein N2381_06105 [Armatimonadetes bacterium]|nr:hypothetical protein [Armatimonadota bacterium]